MRWRYVGAIGVIMGAMILPIVSVGNGTATSETECADVEYMWLRGSGQDWGVGLERAAYAEQVAEAMEAAKVAATYKFHEVDYPAIDVDIKAGAGAFVTAGTGTEYGESVRDGVANIVAHIKQEAALCPYEKFVLAGYSQGAHTVGESLPELGAWAERIAYVALLGDPKAYLPEGDHVWPASPEACEQKGLSKYREWAPNCKTLQGALLGRRPYVPIGWEGKVGLYCNDHDFICGSGETPLDTAGHLEYSGVMNLVAEKSVEKISSYYPFRMSDESLAIMRGLAQKQLPMETVFLIDTSESMRENLEMLRGKITELAELTLASGGRVALAEYRGVGAEGYPKLLCGLSCGAKEFSSWLRRVETGGGESKTWRGMWDGLMMAYEDLGWRDNTTKSIIVITDARGSGEVDYEELINKSFSLGGVNTYVSSWRVMIDHEKLVARTGGGTYAMGGDANQVGARFEVLMDDLVGRPVVQLEKSVHFPAVSEMMPLDATSSYGVGAEIESYDWDIHGDGVRELRKRGPKIDWSWHKEMEDYVLVYAKDADGRVGAAAVRIVAGGVPKADDKEEKPKEDERKVSFVPDNRKTNGLNTESWIAESWTPPGRNSTSYKIREQIVEKVEDKAVGILGEGLSRSLGKEPERKVRVESQPDIDLEIVDAGAPPESTSENNIWGWIVGGATVLLSGAGLIGELVVRRR